MLHEAAVAIFKSGMPLGRRTECSSPQSVSKDRGVSVELRWSALGKGERHKKGGAETTNIDVRRTFLDERRELEREKESECLRFHFLPEWKPARHLIMPHIDGERREEREKKGQKAAPFTK